MNDSLYQIVARAAHESLSEIYAPHVDEIVPDYPFEASDRIMRIIRAEQIRLGV